MLFYQKQGHLPRKRHTQFRKSDGTLFSEQLFGTEGFSGVSSLLYHHFRPTKILGIEKSRDMTPIAAVKHNIHPRKLMGMDVSTKGDFLSSKVPLLFNQHIQIGIAAPDQDVSYFYKNADCDEMYFIHEGNGVLRTMMGDISFEYGDYLIIPRGMIYQFTFKVGKRRMLYMESDSPFGIPRRYRNDSGQFLEHAPFCERDIKTPVLQEPVIEQGAYDIFIKKNNQLHRVVYAHHPFDLVGWDGYNFPYGFSIHNFEPITGRIHQPPPVHQTFETKSCVVCSFCPRLYDYHPDAIPAPYNHSNIDSDEVLYYVDGDFMSRNDIEPGVFTLHPGGIPHGPQPGAAERSIGKRETDELAVMIDPFHPLQLTKEAMQVDDGKYYLSWL